MSILSKQYYKCYKYYAEYKEQFMLKDIQMWEAKYNFYFYFKREDIADIKGDIICSLLRDIKKNYDNNIEIRNIRNYVITVCKKDLVDRLREILKDRQKIKKYKSEWKLKMIDAKNRKNETLLTTLDDIPYIQVRELFKAVLDIKEMTVIFLVHIGYNYCKIGETLNISADYCRKLYNQAESKITKAIFE